MVELSKILNDTIDTALNTLGDHYVDTYGITGTGKGKLIAKQKLGDYIVDHTRAVVHVDPANDAEMARVEKVRWLAQGDVDAIPVPAARVITDDQASELALAEEDKSLASIAPHQVGQKVVRVEVTPTIIDGSKQWFTKDVVLPLAVIAVRVQRTAGSTTVYLDPSTGETLGWAPPTP
ncbi:hypothetical protein M0R72_06040 [Candidatus Pacearchaeota archaeon]|jgi:hypothetical protein|nr:hypothetical protein [Candidatus Pacearchaeota archaeon]